MSIEIRNGLRCSFSSPTDPGFAHEPGLKINLRIVVCLLLCLSLPGVSFGFSQDARTVDPPAATSSITGKVSVTTSPGETKNLTGVLVKLGGPSTGSTLRSTLTDESGHFQFTQLAAGTYTLEVSAEGLRSWRKTV